MARAAERAGVTGQLPSPADLLARYYDLDLQDDPGDLDLYLAMAARTGGGVLELAVGSGRLAVPLARAGHQVTGVDLDPAMLARARSAWERGQRSRASRRSASGSLELIEADLVTLDLRERFGLAFIALNSLFQVGPAERQRAAIATLARHLRPGGVAVVDVELPDAAELASWDGRLVLDWIREDPEAPGTTVMRTSSARHDAVTASTTLSVIYDSTDAAGVVRRVSRTDQLHLIAVSQLKAAAAAAGLEIEQLAGDHQVTPLGPISQRVVLVAVTL
jgi:SAM-dependent methyltransferase